MFIVYCFCLFFFSITSWRIKLLSVFVVFVRVLWTWLELTLVSRAAKRHLSPHWRQPRRGCRGHIPPIFWLGGRQREYPRQYYYVLLDIADQYWLPSIRSASSRFHSAIRRYQFASVRQSDSRLTRLVPPNLELALTPLCPQPAGQRISALMWVSRVSDVLLFYFQGRESIPLIGSLSHSPADGIKCISVCMALDTTAMVLIVSFDYSLEMNRMF